MKTIIYVIAKKYLNSHLRTKILLQFLIVLLLVTFLISGTYKHIYNIALDQKVSDMANRTLSAIGGSFDALIEMENSYSKVILSNNDVQEILKKQQGLLDLSRTRAINSVLTGQLEVNTLATSVYIIDNKGNRYGVDKNGLKAIRIVNSDISTLPWYQKISAKQGGFSIVKNGGGMFIENPKEDFISLIRIINSLQNFQPIGILVINIPMSSVKDVCLSGNYSDDISMIITDDKDNTVLEVFNDPLQSISQQELQYATQGIAREKVKISGTDYIVAQVKVKKVPWNIMAIIPANTFIQDVAVLGLTTVATLVLSSILLFIGAIIISRQITKPIEKLVASMDSVEKGIFKEVELQVGDDEIGQLKRRYNIMVVQIGELLKKTIAEQKLTRRAELNLLQEQIKPHFLYNTLDSIRSLSITGNNLRVYYAVTALEKYYQICLSNGKEVITIGEEVDSVRNYLRIQRMRYRKLLRVIYSIDDDAKDSQILKLMLQPLAENSIYHGLKPKGKNGIIHISIKRNQDKIICSVEDNGVGMSQDKIDFLINNSEKANARFGIRGIIERLNIYYEGKAQFTIKSINNIGTRVEFTIPYKL